MAAAKSVKAEYPEFDICHLEGNKLSGEEFNADRFKGYLQNNPHVQKVHKHSFYHLAYFSSGAGEHIIDFETFPVRKGMIYFMRPGQIHKWAFKGEVDGYVVNFSPTFFDQFAIGSSIIDQFSFFNLISSNQVLQL